MSSLISRFFQPCFRCAPRSWRHMPLRADGVRADRGFLGGRRAWLRDDVRRRGDDGRADSSQPPVPLAVDRVVLDAAVRVRRPVHHPIYGDR